ncbi:MAG TPA: nucleotidyl transferase AbiEii/AbiGii toxin family protein [Bacteroidales bacterium]
MLSFEEIKRGFRETINIEKNSRDMIKEALQYKALDIIAYYPSNPLIFIGGTCLRFFYGIKRFSEDLDFDILHGVKYERREHEALLEMLCKEFRKEGYNVDFSCTVTSHNVITGKLTFPGLEYRLKTTNNPNNAVHLKIETQPQGYGYTPEKKLINKFGAFNTINVMPIDMLLSSKLFTAIERKKGRDFYDIIELSSITKAHEGFLKFLFEKKGYRYESPNDIKELILHNIKNIDWKEKVHEVSLFLLDKQDIKKVELFPLWVEQTDFNSIVNKEKN